MPLLVDDDVQASGPVSGDFVVGFDVGDKMMHIVFQEVFCPKVIYADGEGCFPYILVPLDKGVFHCGVSIW